MQYFNVKHLPAFCLTYNSSHKPLARLSRASSGLPQFSKYLDDGLAVTVIVKSLCEQYWRALQLGEPHILSEAEMRDVFQQFKGYGKWAI